MKEQSPSLNRGAGVELPNCCERARRGLAGNRVQPVPARSADEKISGQFLVCRPKRPHNAAMCLHVTYAARSFTSADVADLAQCAQQKKRPLTSTPCPMTLHLQCSQVGAIAWIAHSRLSKVCRDPSAINSKALSYSLPQTSHFVIGHLAHSHYSRGPILLNLVIRADFSGT